MEIRPLTGSLGAEILGADVRDRQQFDAIRAAFTQYSIVVLRWPAPSKWSNLNVRIGFGFERRHAALPL